MKPSLCITPNRKSRGKTFKPSSIAPSSMRNLVPFPCLSPVDSSHLTSSFHTENASGNSRVYNIMVNKTSDSNASTPVYERVNNAPIGTITGNFSGRVRELEAIRRAFDASHDSGVLTPYALYGEAGIGKTQLALQLAKLTFEDKACSHIFYISGVDAPRGFEEVFDIIHPSGIAHLHGHAKLYEVRRWLEEPPTGVSWLLILDRVTQGSVNFLKEHLPSKGGNILLTTQSQEVAEAFNAIAVELGPLDVDDAVDLLLSTIKLDRNSSSRVSAESIVRHLGSLPIPIQQAAAICAHNAGGDLSSLLQERKVEFVCITYHCIFYPFH